MKPSAITDLRMRILRRALPSKSLLQAIGLMELVWHFAADRYPDGRIPCEAGPLLCAFADYDYDDPLDLMLAVEDSGFGKFEDDVLVLADWEEFQPGHVTDRLRKREQRARSRDSDEPGPDPGPGQGLESPIQGLENMAGENVSRDSDKKGEEGEGGVGVSEKGAQEEKYRLQAEEAKPPKKRRRDLEPGLSLETINIPEEIDNQANRDALARWFAYRKRRGQKYTDPTAFTRMLATFIDDPPGMLDMAVDHSMANGYTGLFRPRDKPGRDTQVRKQVSEKAFDNLEKELAQ